MPDISILDILSGPNLCGVIQEVKSGVINPFDPAFLDSSKSRKVDGNTATFKRYLGSRQNARLSAYGAASKNRQQRQIGEVPVVLLHSNDNVLLGMPDYANLLSYTDLKKQNKGGEEIGRQLREAQTTLMNARISALTSALFQGQIHYDSRGELLPTSTGATTSVSMQIPAGNQTQLNVLGAGNIIGASWANVATAIDTQMIALKQAAARLTGYEITTAYYGRNIPGLLTANTKLQNYFIRNVAANNAYVTNTELPSPLLGFNWKPAYASTFEDVNGDLQTLVDDDTVVFTSDVSSDWYELIEGSYPIPKDYMPSPTAPQEAFDYVHGMFAYAVPINDPPTAKIVYGDTFLPVIKNPKTVFIAKVVF